MSHQNDAAPHLGVAKAHVHADFSSIQAARFLFTSQLPELYERGKQSQEGTIWVRLLREMKINFEVDPADLARVPATGPVVVVANHPFGILDGVILTAMLLRVRTDVR